MFLLCVLSFALCAGPVSLVFAAEKGSGTFLGTGSPAIGGVPVLLQKGASPNTNQSQQSGDWGSPGYLSVKESQSQDRPQRIVSLSTVVTEEIFLLGEGKRLVGRSRFCDRPAEARKIPEAGSIVDVNLEKVVSLAPDLVIVTPMINPRAIAKMRALGLRVETFAPAKSFKGVNDSYLRLARMLGKEAEAEHLAEEQKKAVELLRQKVPQGPALSVFLEVGAEPLVTVTRDSFLNDLIEFAGGKNIAAGAERALYSREKVLVQDPDMIIISSMGFDGEKEKRLWKKYPELKAARGNRIVIVNSDLFCSPTPVTFSHALERMIQILHPSSGVHANDAP